MCTSGGASLFAVAADALRYFASPHWKGPKPTNQTVLEITLVGDDRKWHVRSSRVEQWCQLVRESKPRPVLLPNEPSAPRQSAPELLD